MAAIASKGALPKPPTKSIRIPPRAVSVRRIYGPPVNTAIQVDARNDKGVLVFSLVGVTGAALPAPLAIPDDAASFTVSCANEVDVRQVRIEFVLDSYEIAEGS